MNADCSLASTGMNVWYLAGASLLLITASATIYMAAAKKGHGRRIGAFIVAALFISLAYGPTSFAASQDQCQNTTPDGAQSVGTTTPSTPAPADTAPTTPTTPTTPAPAPVVPLVNNPTVSPSAWSMKFNDEFSGTSINTADWNTGWFGTGLTPAVNSGDPYCFDTANNTVSGGYLEQQFLEKSVTCNGNSRQYTGSMMNTMGKHEFTYGYFETRMQIPTDANAKPYNWMTFWLNGANWPDDGEIDVTEQANGTILFNSHYGDGTGAAYQNGPVDVTGDYSRWHTYGVDWEPTYIKYYYDGNLIGTFTQHITTAPMYLLLTYGAGANEVGTPYLSAGQTVNVDYVRVWQQ